MRRGALPARIVSVAVVVMLVATGLGVFFFTRGTQTAVPSASGPTASSSSSASSASSTVPPINFTKAYLAHLYAYQNRTECTFSKTCVYSYVVLNDYANQSVVVWQNQAPGGPGNFSGLLQIQQRYQAITGIASSINFTVLSIVAIGNQVSAAMNITGTSGMLGNFHGTIKVQTTYDYNGSWYISKEIWNFVVLEAPNAVVPPT